MALETSQTLTVLGVAAILLAIVFWNAMQARNNPHQKDAIPATDSNLLCKFVTYEGSVVGETVAQEGDTLILKQAGVFKSVPLGQISPDGAELALSGPIDWSDAEAAGAKWHEERTKGADDEITTGLTRSEDVKAPALDAFQRRQQEEE